MVIHGFDIFSILRRQDIHKSYREKVQKYASEEKHLLEDLRHGLILGPNDFVEKIHKQYFQPR